MILDFKNFSSLESSVGQWWKRKRQLYLKKNASAAGQTVWAGIRAGDVCVILCVCVDCRREAFFSPDFSAPLLKPTELISSFAKKNTLISGFPLIKS